MNKIKNIQDLPIKQYRIILSILLVEFLISFFCSIHISAFQKNSFIGFEQDPLLWIIYLSGLPTFILAHPTLSYGLDAAVIILLVSLLLKPVNKIIAGGLLIALLMFYSIFTAHLGHRNYQSGYLFVLLPFLFSKTINRQIIFEFIRYFLLFFYISASFFKLNRGAIFNSEHLSHAVVNQFTPYFLEHSTSVRTAFNLYIITHNQFAQVLFFVAFLFEFAMIIGFFTKRFDKHLAVAILTFHFVNWFIMDIAPIGQIAFICTLFFSQSFLWQAPKTIAF